MRIFFVILVSLLISFSASSQEDVVETSWRFEAYYSSFAMRNTVSPVVGSAALYDASEKWSFGLRSLMSLEGKPSESLVSLGLVQRYYAYVSKSSLFFQLSQSMNQANRTTSFSSAGLSIGIDHNLTDELLIGGFSGFEFDLGSNREGENNETGDVLVYPKICVLIGMKL